MTGAYWLSALLAGLVCSAVGTPALAQQSSAPQTRCIISMPAWCIALSGELELNDRGETRVWLRSLGKFTPSGPLTIVEDKKCDAVVSPVVQQVRDEFAMAGEARVRTVEYMLDERLGCRIRFEFSADEAVRNQYEQILVSSFIVAGQTLKLRGRGE